KGRQAESKGQREEQGAEELFHFDALLLFMNTARSITATTATMTSAAMSGAFAPVDTGSGSTTTSAKAGTASASAAQAARRTALSFFISAPPLSFCPNI